MQFLHRDERNRDTLIETKMKEKLPENLRIELLKSAYSIFYKKIFTIFLNPEAIRFLFHLTERKYTSNQQVFDQYERANSLVYLHKGLVQLRLKLRDTMYFLYETNISNEFLGQYELFLR